MTGYSLDTSDKLADLDGEEVGQKRLEVLHGRAFRQVSSGRGFRFEKH